MPAHRSRADRIRRKLTPQQRRNRMARVLQRQGNVCAMQFCRRPLSVDDWETECWRPTLDHTRPLSQGGSGKIWNLRAVCKRCHLKLNDCGQCAGAVVCALSISAGWRPYAG